MKPIFCIRKAISFDLLKFYCKPVAKEQVISSIKSNWNESIFQLMYNYFSWNAISVEFRTALIFWCINSQIYLIGYSCKRDSSSWHVGWLLMIKRDSFWLSFISAGTISKSQTKTKWDSCFVAFHWEFGSILIKIAVCIR